MPQQQASLPFSDSLLGVVVLPSDATIERMMLSLLLFILSLGFSFYLFYYYFLYPALLPLLQVFSFPKSEIASFVYHFWLALSSPLHLANCHHRGQK